MFFLSDMLNRKLTLPGASEALLGRDAPIATANHHAVNGRPLLGPYPEGCETAYFAMGRFWAAERLFWPLEGVWVTAVGYAGGFTRNPTLQEASTGMTGHAETVMVVYDPAVLRYGDLLARFWANHDPTQGMRQGSDIGTLYRSMILTTTPGQHEQATASRVAQAEAIAQAGRGTVTTEVAAAVDFYLAETDQQQYLARRNERHRSAGGGAG